MSEESYRCWLRTPFSRPRPTSHTQVAAENEQLREQVRELHDIADEAIRALYELAYGFGAVSYAEEQHDALVVRFAPLVSAEFAVRLNESLLGSPDKRDAQ